MDVSVIMAKTGMLGEKNPLLEAVYGSLSGMAFGLLSPLASQPFDTIKTKMQAEVFVAFAIVLLRLE